MKQNLVSVEAFLIGLVQDLHSAGKTRATSAVSVLGNFIFKLYLIRKQILSTNL
jgi:hypothetical protein